MSLFPYLVTNLHQLQVPGNKLGCTKGTVLSGHQGYSIPLLVHALKDRLLVLKESTFTVSWASVTLHCLCSKDPGRTTV